MNSGILNAVAGVAKFILGVSLAIAILVGGGAFLALYFVHQITTRPPKPVFANDPGVENKEQPSASTSTPTPTPINQPPTAPTPSTSPSPTSLEPGAYYARVTWSDGLSLRAEPKAEAERVGGVDYNQQIVVLAETPDKKWQKIRLEGSKEEGWIKAGNIEPVQE